MTAQLTLRSGDYVAAEYQCRAEFGARCRMACNRCNSEKFERCICESELARAPDDEPKEQFNGEDQPVRGPGWQPIVPEWNGDSWEWDYAPKPFVEPNEVPRDCSVDVCAPNQPPYSRHDVEGTTMSDMMAELGEIGGDMVDELIDGIQAHCTERPNPLLTPERHFFRELGSGLLAMSHDDLVTLCAAAITRIAYPQLQARSGVR